jgi:dTDP-3-amino-3,4,6-trideoxy-alpha-D-glucopyranose N,N-dimethyltransferase
VTVRCHTVSVFERSVELYDLIYSDKDYEGEAKWVRDAVQKRCPDARRLLDVACGTGSHLAALQSGFASEGVDSSPQFVNLARKRSGVPVHQGDMDGLDLGKQFDAVICMFSSIGYSTNLDDAITSMARHLYPGGVLIVEPWFTPDEWMTGSVQVLVREDDGLRVIRMSRSSVEGRASVIEMHHLVGTSSTIEHFVEIHRMTLFGVDQYESAFRRAGLSYELVQPGPSGRGALIGMTPR